MEEQDVTIDGSATRDANDDPVRYEWKLLSKPTGSNAGVHATSASFVFRPDVPGTYELRLTAHDAHGSTSDTMRVAADALFTLPAEAGFRIDAASAPGSDRLELRLKTSPHYSGSPVSFTASSNAAWLTVSPATGTFAAPGSDAIATLGLAIEELGRLGNGKYAARVTISPAGGWSTATSDVSLDFVLPVVDRLVPYVAYAGRPERVTLYGEQLLKANGRSLFINDVEAPNVSAVGDDRATIELPPLSAGTYTVRVGHALDISREMGRVVVLPAPSYDDADVSLPGPPRSVEYDAERDRIYGIFDSPTAGPLAIRVRRVAGVWQQDQIGVGAMPLGIALSVDGQELIVSTDACTIEQLDAETLARIRTTDTGCVGFFHSIVALADERVLLVDSGPWQETAVWEFPALTRADFLPLTIDVLAMLNYERNRMLWAEQPPTEQEYELYYYDIGSGAATLVSPHDVPAYMHHTLAISGDGSRTLHIIDVYDRNLQFIGTLDVPFPRVEGVVPGLGRNGTRAVVVHCDADSILTHDLTGPGPVFPATAAPIVLPAGMICGLDTRLLVPPSDAAAFLFATTRVDSIDTFSLYVRSLP